MVVIVASLKARPGAEAQLESVLRTLVEKTRSEPGARAYSIHREAADPGAFVVYERYVDTQACDRHMGALYVREAFGQFEALLAMPPSVKVLDELEGWSLAGTSDVQGA